VIHRRLASPLSSKTLPRRTLSKNLPPKKDPFDEHLVDKDDYVAIKLGSPRKEEINNNSPHSTPPTTLENLFARAKVKRDAKDSPLSKSLSIKREKVEPKRESSGKGTLSGFFSAKALERSAMDDLNDDEVMFLGEKNDDELVFLGEKKSQSDDQEKKRKAEEPDSNTRKQKKPRKE